MEVLPGKQCILHPFPQPHQLHCFDSYTRLTAALFLLKLFLFLCIAVLYVRRVYIFQIVFSKKREFLVNKSKCTLQIASKTPLVLIGKVGYLGMYVHH